MPKYRVDTDRGSFLVELDREPSSQAELHALVSQRIGSGSLAPTGIVPRFFRGVGSYLANPPGWQGVKAGTGSTLQGLAQLPQFVMGAREQIPADWERLTTSPGEAIPEQMKRAGQMLWGMAPFRESFEEAASGKRPSLETLYKGGTELALSQAISAAGGKAIKGGARAFVKELPGAGVELQAMAIPEAEALVARMQPGMPAVRAAYQAVREMGNPKLHMGRIREIAQDIVDHESRASKPRGDLLKQAQRILDTSTEGWDWEHAVSEVRRMGEDTRALRKVQGEIPKEMTDLYSALRQDVDTARPLIVEQVAQQARPAGRLVDEQGRPLTPAQPSQPAVVTAGARTPEMIAQTGAWKNAQRMARRQFASEELADRINKAVGMTGESFSSFSVNKVSKWIDQQERAARLGHPESKARMFVGSFEKGELADYKRTLKDISRNMAALPSMRGTPVGSAQRVLHYGLGQIVGEFTGHPYLGGPGAIVLGEGISRLMQTAPARAFVRRAMRIAPVTSPAFNNAVAAFIRSQSGEGQLPESLPMFPNTTE